MLCTNTDSLRSITQLIFILVNSRPLLRPLLALIQSILALTTALPNFTQKVIHIKHINRVFLELYRSLARLCELY